MTRYRIYAASYLLWLATLLLQSVAFGQNGALRVTEPVATKDGTVATSEPSILLAGTLAWTGGDRRVLWKSNRGFSDLATVTLDDEGQTIRWATTVPVPLRPGMNHVQVRALGQSGAATFVNVYYTPSNPPSPHPMGTTMLHGKQITYEVVDGRAVYQGDIILGRTEDVARGRFAGRFARSGLRLQGATIALNFQSSTGLWPVVNGVVRVPYANPSGVSATNVNAAVAESNTQLAGILQWLPATASDVNMVNFAFTSGNESGTCESNIGMAGGTQSVGGADNCGVGTIMHEMGHAVGLYHEQSRTDRDTYVSYLEANIDKPQYSNFDKFDSGVDSGLFNYASIMEYGAFSFSRDGISPVLETIPAGIPLSTDASQYTAGDLDAIMRLYGHPPSSITVDTNPTGLQVVVDGTPCTAPCVFSGWTIGSQHTLGVPLDGHGQTLQTLSQQPYVFGRWNASVANQQSVTITNSAGDGTLLSPSTSPAITNYLASFIPVHPYNVQVTPGGSGSITASPPPSSLFIGDVSTSYYLDRQFVTLTVHPSSGYNFYVWYNFLGFNFYSNPYALYVTQNLDYYNFTPSEPVEAGMVTDPVLTIASASPDITAAGSFGGLAVAILNNGGSLIGTAYTPRNYAAGSDSGFTAGEQLTLCASYLNGNTCPGTPTAQTPVTFNINYLFNHWSNSGNGTTDALSITMPTGSSQATYTANYTPSFRTIVVPSWYCGNTAVTASPTGNDSTGTGGNLDAFFTAGTVDFTANTGSSGLSFFSWSQDLGGSSNPNAFSLSNQAVGTANFNVPQATAALSVTSVSPATPTVTSAAVDLVVTGTGFTTNSGVTHTYFVSPVDGSFQFRTNTLTSPTQLTIHLSAGDFATAGYHQFAVYNQGASCSPYVIYTFPVANSAGPPAFTVSKMHSGDFAPGQVGALYTVQVTNSGTGPISAPVSVKEAVPSGETLQSMSGTGWNCTIPTCTRSDSLGVGLSYPAITVTVNVVGNATSPQINSVTVSGGGAASATETDSTIIHAQVAVPNVVGFTQAAATTAIQNQGLVVGTVTMQSSNSVPSGDVISESPTAGTTVNEATAVNLVVSTGSSSPTLQSIVVTPASPSIAKGLTQQFTATGHYSDSSTSDLTSSVSWSSGTPATATITSGGLATAVNTGTSTITATLSAVQGSTVLTVTAAVLQSIVVTPASPSIAKGLTQQFTATGHYSDASTQDLTGSVTWASGTPGTATITAVGLATAVTTGTSAITATSGAVQGATVLTVTAAALQSIVVTPTSPSVAKGLTQQFTATGHYSDSSTSDLTSSVSWASGTPATATITSGGLATAVTAGTSTITATSGAVQGSTVLTVTAATLQSIVVTPASPSVAKGLTQQFTATGHYSDSSTSDLTSSATWASGTPGTATITSGGLATAVATGTSTITATSGAVQGTTVLTVTAAALQSIVVTPASPSVAKGLTQQFTATGHYSDSSTQDLTNSASWSSGTPATATITSGGLATAVNTGTSTITATSGAVQGSTVLTVTAATLQSIVVTPGSPFSIAKGLTQQFTATGHYSDSSTQDLTNSASWSSGTPATATITSGGLATAVNTGTSTITATLSAVQGSTVLTVTAAVLQSIVVTPASPSIAKGLTQQFTATGHYSDASTQDLTGSVTWASGTPGTATITAVGLATAVTTGTSAITATSGAVQGATVLTVTAAALQSIVVTPTSPSVAKGLTQQFTATGHYSDSSTSDLTSSVSWASGTPATATITSGGLATAVTAGTSTITATSGAVQGSTVLTVTAATLQSIVVTPASPSIAKGLTQQFTATGHYSDASSQDLTGSATWASGTPATATITASGLATAVATGTSAITATSGAVQGPTVLTVTAATLQSIVVTPTSPSVAKGLTQQFTATGHYSDSSTSDLTSSVSWSSGTPGTATITAAGLATAVATRTSTITATLSAVQGSTVLTVTAAALQSIVVTPANPSIAKGLTQQFAATGHYSDSSTSDLTSSATWASATPATATIAAGGLATAVATGTSAITATSGAVQGSTVLTVTAAVLQSIVVTPASPSIAKGLTQQFTATGHYSDSSTSDLTSSVTWASGTPANATITSGGLATAVATGTSAITATLSAVQGSTVLTVTAAILQSIVVKPASPSITKGLTQQFTATGHYSDASTQDLTGSVTWASGTPGTATITSGGLATAVATGTSTITATLSAVQGSTVLTVTAAALQSIVVTPASPSIAKGLTQQFTATGHYSDSSTQDLTVSATWASGTPGTATITSGGLATAVATGTSTITATLSAVQGSTVLTVTAAILQSIVVKPASPSITKGLTQQFTATGHFSDGTTPDLTSSVTWASGTPATATITAGGLATTVNTGTTSISATLSAVQGATVLTVTAAILQSIVVTPASPSITKGSTQQFTATGHFSDGTTPDLTGSVTWASSTPATATITAGGLATTVNTGTTSISATLSAVQGATVLTVTAATLQSITVTPASPSITKGSTQQFTATGHYSDSSTQDLTSSATWSSTTPATATITSGGLATAVATGTSTITATLSAVQGSTVLTVTAAALQSIVVTPASPSIAKGLTQQFTATGHYSDSSTQDLTSSATWSSTTPATATITSGGLATAVNTGATTITATVSAVQGATLLSVTAPGLGTCDLNHDGTYTALDAQSLINQALGISTPSVDIDGDGVVSVVDVNIVINAVLQQGCTTH